MADLNSWSTTAASNASVGAVNFAEGQLPSTVNNSAREIMKHVADVRDAAVTLSGWYVTGHLIQTVYAEYTTNADLTTAIPIDDTIPQNTEGTEVVTASITPKKATSKIRVRFNAIGTLNTQGALSCALFKDSDASALSATVHSIEAAGFVRDVNLAYEHTAGGVSAITYKIRVGPNIGTARLNGNTSTRFFGGASRAVLTLEEIGV
jgi:hypothetical protein